MTAHESGTLMNLVTGSLLPDFGVRDVAKSDFAGFALARNSENFEHQLAALIGKDSARNSQARMFNEQGFFGARVSHASALAVESGDNPSSVRSSENSWNTGSIVSSTDGANARSIHESHGLRQFSATTGEHADRAIAHYSMSTGTISKSGPVRASFAILESDMSVPKLSSDNKAAMTPTWSTGRMNGLATAELNGKPAPFLSRSPASSVTSQVHQLKNQSPVKLALRELESGLKLAVEVKHLTREQKQTLKSELLSLLAQHGLGNYDLKLNNDLFSNQMAPRQEK